MLLTLALPLAAGCGDTTTPFVPEDVTRTDAGLPQYDGSTDRVAVDRPAPDVLDLTDVPLVDDVATSDVPCAPMLSTTVTFGLNGGLVAFTERFTLTAPLSFRAERRSGGPTGTVTAMCMTTLPGCNTTDMVDVGELNAALAARDVQVALGFARGMPMMEALYGYDPRPVDEHRLRDQRRRRAPPRGRPLPRGHDDRLPRRARRGAAPRRRAHRPARPGAATPRVHGTA